MDKGIFDKTFVRGDIMVLDNTSFHKDGIIRRFLKKVGCGICRHIHQI